MSHPFIDPMHGDSLVFLIESVASKILRSHSAPICLELDIDAKLGLPASSEAVVCLVTSLMEQALAEMPKGGDLNITAVESSAGLVELEIADTGSAIGSRPRSLPLAAASIGAELQWHDCPQGGGAVTIVFANRAQSDRASDQKAA